MTAPVCDTHSHVFSDGSGKGLDDYLGAARAAGVTRHVVVQAKAQRHDPQCTPAAITRLGLDRARGVVWDDARYGDEDLFRLHRAGVRGIRFLFEGREAVNVADLRAGAQRIAALGWHLLVQADGSAWPACADALVGLPCSVVVDHMGRIASGVPTASPEFRALLRFARNGGWVKLSAPYYGTHDRSADFRPLADRVRALLDAAPQRMVWAMNWPHLNVAGERRPDDAATLASLTEILGSGPAADAVLAHNAARLYGFDAASASAGSEPS